MLNCHTKETLNIAIYTFSSGKFLNVSVYACVKDLTNIMSDSTSKATRQMAFPYRNSKATLSWLTM